MKLEIPVIASEFKPSPESGILIGESEASRERRRRRFLEPLSATANNADNDDSPAQSFVSENGVLITAVFLVVVAQLTLGFHSHVDCEFFMESGLNWDLKLANELYERIKLAFQPWQYVVRDDCLDDCLESYNVFT